MSVVETVDIDQLIKNYKRSRSRTVLLATSIILMILGVCGSFFTIQTTSEKLNSTTQSAVQMAELSLESGYCEVSQNRACQKAKEILNDPARAHSEGNPNPTAPAEPAIVPLKENPTPQIMFMVMSTAMILRVQLDTTSVLRKKTWN